MLVNSYYEKHVEQLFEIIDRFSSALKQAGIEYRIVGGMAVYLHVNEVDPVAARLTRDVDVAVKRADLERIGRAVKPFGLEFRHVAGVDMLVDSSVPKARSAVHLVFVNEKVRPHYLEPVPKFSPAWSYKGWMVAPVADLMKMKLTSFRDKDRVHIRDLDSVGLITPEIEAGLPEQLRERLTQVRASE